MVSSYQLWPSPPPSLLPPLSPSPSALVLVATYPLCRGRGSRRSYSAKRSRGRPL
ncbi:hypothetical protein LC55x_4167 [Lysobacter capsici]|nr:hypothetical protein LC55x_4167 [Lysobacter capsici]